MDLVARLLAGDVRALARAMSLIENEAPETPALLDAVYPRTGRALVLGVTVIQGDRAPGAGDPGPVYASGEPLI